MKHKKQNQLASEIPLSHLPNRLHRTPDLAEIQITTSRPAHLDLCTRAAAWMCIATATVAISGVTHAATIEIEASALLNADVATAWRVLTDYQHYVDFIPGLRASRVVARNGATVTVEQSGEVVLGLLHVPLDVTFEITEIAPTLLVSRVVAGDLRALNSRYMLTAVGSGVRLEYTGTLDSGLVLSGAIERHAVEQNVNRRFDALANEIERRNAALHGQSRIELPQEGGRSTRVSAVLPAPER